jgi:uncharacterized protein YfaS (alpha-2-macroglobulin family)
MNTYDKGDRVKLSVVFSDADTGDPVDPTTVTAKVKDPVGTVSNYIVAGGQIVHDGLGNFSLEIDPNVQGTWCYRFEGTGTNKGAEESTFSVRPSEFD